MHLDCRNGTYHATLKIPKELREALGKTSFRKSLKTKDKIIAMGKAAPLFYVDRSRMPEIVFCQRFVVRVCVIVNPNQCVRIDIDCFLYHKLLTV